MAYGPDTRADGRWQMADGQAGRRVSVMSNEQRVTSEKRSDRDDGGNQPEGAREEPSLLRGSRVFDVPHADLPSARAEHGRDHPLEAHHGPHLLRKWQLGQLAPAGFFC